MIELDDLKNIWSSNIENDIGKQSVEQEKIRTLLKNKSTNIIDKVRTNLLREIIMFCVCLLLVACVPVYLQTKEVFILCAIIVVVIFIPYLIYYSKNTAN
jgi:Flp pilus assembly protein TadB